MISPEAVLCGLLFGAGAALVVAELLPSRPDLASVAAVLDPAGPDTPGSHGDLPARVGSRLLPWLGQLVRARDSDLAVLGVSRARHVGTQALLALAGLVLPQVLTVVLATAGAGRLIVLPMAASLGIAAALWVNCDIDVRARASKRRGEARFAVASYLERVALERAADAGAADALRRAAAVGDSWVLQRLRDALRGAELSGLSPWEALRRLAVELDVPELARPADTLALAGEEGAPVYDTLTAQAASLRDALRAEAQTAAGEASTRMVLPVTALVVLLLVLILYPAMIRIVSA